MQEMVKSRRNMLASIGLLLMLSVHLFAADIPSAPDHVRVHDLTVSDAAEVAELAKTGSFEFVGPDSASLSVPCDATLNNVSITPDAGVVPLYEPCLMNTNTVIWRNVSLADVTSFSAVIGGSAVGGKWRTPQFIGNNTTNASGTVTVQYQYKTGSYLEMIAVAYSQSNADVIARVSRNVYKYNKELGYAFSDGSQRTLTNTVDGANLAICQLGCTLRDSADQRAVKTFTLSNSDANRSSYETVSVYEDSLMKTNVIVWKDTDLSKVTGFSAQMAGDIFGTEWKDVSAYCFKTNSNGAITCQFQYVKPPAANNILYSAEVVFQQFGADVYACITRCVRQYYKELGTDLSQIGSSVAVAEIPTSSAIALRNITGVWERPYRYEYGTTYPQCLTNVATTVWRDVRLSDVTGFSARMGGTRTGSKWVVANSYNQKTNATTGAITCQFQWRDGYTRCAIVEFSQSGNDVSAKVTRTCYQYDPLGTDLAGIGTVVPCVDAVGGTGIALRDVSCKRLRRVPHTVTFNGFDPNDTPELVLNDIDLLLAGTKRGDAIMPQEVRRRGAVKAGYITVTNACVIAADGGLVTETDGTICFDITSAVDRFPSITASRVSLSPDTDIVMASDSLLPEAFDRVPQKLIIGGMLAPDALQNISLSFAGELKERCKGVLSVDEDGDVAVTVRKIRGFVISVR